MAWQFFQGLKLGLPSLDEKLQKLGFKVKLHLNEERWHCLVVGR